VCLPTHETRRIDYTPPSIEAPTGHERAGPHTDNPTSRPHASRSLLAKPIYFPRPPSPTSSCWLHYMRGGLCLYTAHIAHTHMHMQTHTQFVLLVLVPFRTYVYSITRSTRQHLAPHEPGYSSPPHLCLWIPTNQPFNVDKMEVAGLCAKNLACNHTVSDATCMCVMRLLFYMQLFPIVPAL
jgi:hypothetical protein